MDDCELAALFQAARHQAPRPSDVFMERVMADAIRHCPRPYRVQSVSPTGAWRRWWDALRSRVWAFVMVGGAGAVASLGVVMASGLWMQSPMTDDQVALFLVEMEDALGAEDVVLNLLES